MKPSTERTKEWLVYACNGPGLSLIRIQKTKKKKKKRSGSRLVRAVAMEALVGSRATEFEDKK